MIAPAEQILSLVVAMGIGLLIGVERERRKGEGTARAAAGLRTFTVAGLLGAVAMLAGGSVLLSVALAGVIALAAISYLRSKNEDPGLTTEIVLILTAALGGLAVAQAELAAGIGVVVTVVLAAREPMHHFAKRVLTESELKSALTLAAATLVVWPIMPDRFLGPYEAVNLRNLWTVVVLAMAIGAVGHVAVRVLGTRFGLPLAGLASGFVSSSATIAAMGDKAVGDPRLLAPAAAAAVLSNIATIIQASILIAAVSPATISALALPLSLAGLLAIGYGLVFALRASSADVEVDSGGEAFKPSTALILAALIAGTLVLAAAARVWLGDSGVIVAAAAAGLADAHSAAMSVASLVASGKLQALDARLPIVIGLTANAFVKCLLAVSEGGRAFAIRVVPGVVLITAGLWIGMFVA
ncbi:MAG: DUF4010 domain-containing protein [Hyphomicrobiales bacterium]|nr:MAG: DUF4010 domain-containing protein [Hyphomicrobiales bacterium]